MKMNFLLVHSALSLIAAFLFSGCSSAPSVSDGEAVIRNKIEAQSSGLIKLVNYSKINSQKMEPAGMQMLIVEWQGEIEFLQDCYWGPFDVVGSWSGDFYATTDKPNARSAFFLSPQNMGKRAVKKGQRTKISGKLTFEKTEKGWKGEDGKIH